MGDLELQIFSDRIKQLRNELNLTQRDFAEKIGVTAAALSAYENNQKNPSIAVAKKIAESFHVSIDWLCGLSDDKGINGDMRTYSDIIAALIAIEKKIKITCDSSRIMMYNKKVSKFLGDWKGMINLHSNGTIDDNLYNLWIAQQLKLYDCTILSKDGSLETKEIPDYCKDTEE